MGSGMGAVVASQRARSARLLVVGKAEDIDGDW
jgi:hypothetical protein